MAKRVFLARHAETQGLADRVAEGWTPGSLSEKGVFQAHALGERLRREKIDVVLCSDLARCRETLDHFGLEAPVEFHAELRESNLGEWEGTPWTEINFNAYHFHPHHRPPGGESIEDLRQRVMPFFRKILERAEETILVVGHHNPTILMLCELSKTPVESWRVFKQARACLNELAFDEGIWRIARVNDTSHLEKISPDE